MSMDVAIWRHPIPNSPQLSSCAFAHPIATNCSRVHWVARARLEEPVNRGPISSNNAVA